MYGMAESDHAPLRAQAALYSQDTVAERKSVLRKRLIRDRSRLSPAERAEAGRSLRDTILVLPEIGMAGAVAAYLSLGTEPDTHGLVFGLWKRGSYVLLPVLRDDNELDWACYEGPLSLAPGPRGLVQPTTSRRGVAGIASADAVIVPALAADRVGNRIGRGGGSYDRALSRVGPAVLTIALLYEAELLDEVPVGAHDQRVRAVAQPSRGLTRFA